MASTLWPAPQDLEVDRIIEDEHALTLLVRTYRPVAYCPLCQQPSQRVHSCYGRHLADLPWHGVAVRLQVRTRRFFCTTANCPQHIFTERLPNLVRPHARRTLQLQAFLHQIALALGGRAGARLAHSLGLNLGRDSMLDLLQQQPLASVPTPRVLGVDDFALRRGHRYGTILTDLEQHRVIDLLPDRQAETLTAWLKEHPGVKIITRDRSPLYAEGAAAGAPEAVQVADRWHLLKNLTEAVEKLLIREQRSLHTAHESTPQIAVPPTGAGDSRRVTTHDSVADSSANVPAFVLHPRLEREKQERRARRLSRYQQVVELYRQGHTQRTIANLTGLSRKTVQRYVQAVEFPEITRRVAPPTKLDAFADYLKARWQAGCHNAAQLYREIRGQGYTGRLTLVKDYLRHLRPQQPATPPLNTLSSRPAASATKLPVIRTVLWWLLRPDELLEEEQRQFVERLCQNNPTVSTARELALWFFRLVRERRTEEFGMWVETVRKSGLPYLRGFVEKLLQDRAAVVAALSSEWSNGQSEGQVNRLKLIKRQMYGRASFSLLRARVLA